MKITLYTCCLAIVGMLGFSTLSLAQLLGGSCEAPIAIGCNISTVIGSTEGVASDNATAGAAICLSAASSGGQMWYSFSNSEGQLITLSTCGGQTNFDTYLSVYAGECGALTCVASNDDGCNSLKSILSFSAEADVEYLVRVGGFASLTGIFELSVSCQEVIGGCMDPNADNYDETATYNDDSCIYEGCTDPVAQNYDPYANEDDGSCSYCNGEGSVSAQLYVCAFANGDQISLDIVNADGVVAASVSGLNDNQIAYVDICLEAGMCYTAQMANSVGLDGWYSGYFWINTNGIQIINQSLDADESYEEVLFSIDGTCTTVLGCTDPEASNFNELANTDDGSCTYPIDCTGLTTITYSLTGGIFIGEVSCTVTTADGTIVFASLPFNSNVVQSGTFCLEDGCYTVNMYDSFGDGWNGAVLTIAYNGVLYSYTFDNGTYAAGSFGINEEGCTSSVIGGCMDPNADNYNSEAIYDDGSCTYSGCTDPNAINYDWLATTDDNTCEYCEGEGSTIANLYVCTFSNGSEVELVISDDEGNVVVTIDGLGSGQIFNTTLCLLPGVCYTATMINNAGPYGWYNGYFWISAGGVQIVNDSPASTSQSESVVFSIDGNCGEAIVYGCTDAFASNYNPEATYNDGSCIYPIYGCTDPTALNYYTYATEDDGTCIYAEECFQNFVTLSLGEGVWSSESSYYITDNEGNYITGGQSAGTVYACIGDGCYLVYMFDSFGDGWINGGPLTITVNGEVSAILNLETGTYGSASFGINSEGCTPLAYGCTDPEALNYNASATSDDASCVYPTDCDDNLITIVVSTQIWGSEISWSLEDEFGNVVAAGGDYGSWNSYTQYLCLPIGCYTLSMDDSWGDGWNGAYYMIYGDGTYAEGTLLYGNTASDLIGIGTVCGDVDGCTDPEALNYNPAATIDDGSCTYNNNPEGGGLGGLVGQEFGLTVYPNPASENMIIDLNNLSDIYDVQMSVMTADGRLVMIKTIANDQLYRREELNVTQLEAGYYILQIANGNGNKSIAFVKE